MDGGPGSGISAGYRRRFDPDRFFIISFEQRGCGRSRPLVTDAAADLSTNTTAALIADIEALRMHLGVERWLVHGASWGTTLALAYAQAHPRRVSELVLFAVTTTSAAEVEWITESVGRVFPREWEQFEAASGRGPGQRLIDAYYERITDPDPIVRDQAAQAWCAWEDTHVSLDPAYVHNPRYDDPQFRRVFATLVRVLARGEGVMYSAPRMVTEQGPSRARSAVALPGKSGVSVELHLIGRTTAEARDLLEKYLDDAFMAGLPAVRIVHGKGTGALRRAVEEVLSGHPLVTDHRPGAPAEGGAGATVATLAQG